MPAFEQKFGRERIAHVPHLPLSRGVWFSNYGCVALLGGLFPARQIDVLSFRYPASAQLLCPTRWKDARSRRWTSLEEHDGPRLPEGSSSRLLGGGHPPTRNTNQIGTMLLLGPVRAQEHRTNIGATHTVEFGLRGLSSTGTKKRPLIQGPFFE